MSEANLALVRECYARVSRGDIAYELVDPDVEIRQSAMLPDTEETFHGHEGIARMLQELWDAFGDIRWEEIRMEAEGDSVVALMRVVGTGHGSGAETETAAVHVWTIRGGRVVRFAAPPSMTEAYRLAGFERPE